MPIYEYTCKSCNKPFEQFVRTLSADAQPPKPKCPECGSKDTARALSVFGVKSDGAGGKAGDPYDNAPICGRCGEAPGSCSM